MGGKDIKFSLFTKPWKNISIDELGKFVSELGFDGIEFPLRPGYQVEPQNAEKELPAMAKKLREEYGVEILSVASITDENIFAACAEAGVPVIRIMVNVDPDLGYMGTEAKKKKELEGLIPLCEKYEVKIGVQQHCGLMTSNCMEVLHLIEDFDPKYIGAIWDAAHSGLAGEEPEQALDIVWSHLCMVNFKNAFYRRINGPEADEAQWGRFFTTGNHGLCSWPRAVKYLKKRGYKGTVCLPAEYTDEANVNRYIAKDIAYIKSLFEKECE